MYRRINGNTHRQQNSKAERTLFGRIYDSSFARGRWFLECHLDERGLTAHPPAPTSQPGGLDVRHRGLETAARGIFQARFGSRASVGSEVSGSHDPQLIRGSPDLAAGDTSPSSAGKPCLRKSRQSHQPDAPCRQGPDRVRSEVSDSDRVPLGPGRHAPPLTGSTLPGKPARRGGCTLSWPPARRGRRIPCVAVTATEAKVSSALVCSFLVEFCFCFSLKMTTRSFTLLHSDT